MITDTVNMTMLSDDQLWQRSVAGDREAFRQIVERYQCLVCSLAYSASGNLSRSEDLAQDTFVTAWHKLGDLREPSKLRAWLCGIVRNLCASAARRELRRGGPTEPLDADHPSTEADPAAQAVSKEEADLLWRALAGLPETYREPLVLFYRQGRSITEVSGTLELSEDAVKQRLSRGRAMLREEMTGWVELTLRRTRPTAAFAVTVLAALPMASASAGSALFTAGTFAAGGTDLAGRGILAKLGLGAFVGPLVGLLFAWLGIKAAASTARSGPERDVILRHARWIIAYCFLLSIGLAGVLSQADKLYPASAPGILIGISLWTLLLVGGILFLCRRMDKAVADVRVATATTDEHCAPAWEFPRYVESRPRLLGLPLFAMEWGGHRMDHYRPGMVCAWIAVGDTAISPFLAFGGLAVAPIAVGAITVGVVSLSLFGVAAGMFALGSLAFGWWAVGFGAAGIKAAAGIVAVARDFAVGLAVSAEEAGNQIAVEWFQSMWLADMRAVMLDSLHWWLLGCVGLALALSMWRNRRMRCATPDER
jgi:RNA polymerase sigma factor (sigma-70 family)